MPHLRYANPEKFSGHIFFDGGSDHRAHRGVHAGGVAAAGQDADDLLVLLVHKKSSILSIRYTVGARGPL